MKKKCFAMLMAVAIVVMSIVGCGGSDNKKQQSQTRRQHKAMKRKRTKIPKRITGCR